MNDIFGILISDQAMLCYVTILTVFQVTTGVLTLSLKRKQKISTAYFQTVNFPEEYRHPSQILAKNHN